MEKHVSTTRSNTKPLDAKGNAKNFKIAEAFFLSSLRITDPARLINHMLFKISLIGLKFNWMIRKASLVSLSGSIGGPPFKKSYPTSQVFLY
jgi:hypothetical protein